MVFDANPCSDRADYVVFLFGFKGTIDDRQLSHDNARRLSPVNNDPLTWLARVRPRCCRYVFVEGGTLNIRCGETYSIGSRSGIRV